MLAVTLPLAALAAGAAAGLGVALPLGAIGVLLLHEGLTRGWRTAAAGATGVALVDLGYVSAALAAGAALNRALGGHARAIQLAGAGVLLAVAARGLAGLFRSRPATAADVGSPGDPRLDAPGPGPSAPRVLARFLALTAINPLTAVYFVVLTTGLGATVHGRAAATAFAAGVFLASWAWQLLLAGAGALAGARLPGWARPVTGAAGYLVVIGYAVRLAAGG